MGAGSARDTLSALDQVVAAGGVTPEQVPLDDLVEGLIAADSGRALAALAVAVQGGRDPRGLAEELIAHLRDGFLSLVAPELVQLPDRRRDVVRDQAERLGLPATVRAIEVLGEMLVELRHAPDPRVLLDVALVKLTNVDADASPAALLARIEKLERAQSAGSGAPTGPVAAARRRGSARGGTRSGGGRAPTGRRASPAPRRRPAAPAPRPPRPDGPRSAAPSTAEPTPPVAAAPRRRAATRRRRPSPAADQVAPSVADRRRRPQPRRADPGLGRPGPAPPVGPGQAGPGRRALDRHRRRRGAGACPTSPTAPAREQHRAELEAALAAHFGRPVPVTFVLEPSTPARPRGAGERGARAAARSRAGGGDRSGRAGRRRPGARPRAVERVTQAFPGAELMDEG